MEMHSVKVDVCQDCQGIWFDAGEIDLMQPEDKHPVRRVIGDFFAGLKK
jgi:Zn-finger nucleic acid-binding protein